MNLRRLLMAALAAPTLLLAAMTAQGEELVAEIVAEPALVVELPQEALAEPEPQREVGRGIASWYGPGFQGRRTANGEVFDMHALTAAHRTLPFGTLVRVRSQVNGREVLVRINDRGPFIGRRIIDLSRAAAQALGLIDSGTGTKPVSLSVPAAQDIAVRPRRGSVFSARRN